MNFNQHFELAGKHAFLSASQYHWTSYNTAKLQDRYRNEQKKTEGTKLHALASDLIVNRMKLARQNRALNKFVNDAIGFGMESEVVLCYSYNCFGTADAIAFKNNVLRIFDLKTGVIEGSFRQLDIYTALFCLEYEKDPFTIEIEHRIYQYKDFVANVPDPEEIRRIMDKIIEFDPIIDNLKLEFQ